MIRDYRYNLQADVPTTINVNGIYIRGLASTAGYNISLDDAAEFTFETGLGYRAAQEFQKVKITSPTDQTILIMITDGEVTDNRLVGQIDIQGKLTVAEVGKSATIAGAAVDVQSSSGLIVAENADRKAVLIAPQGGSIIFIGGPGVTIETGMPVSQSLTLDTTAAIHAICEGSTVDTRIIEEVY